MFVGLQEFVVAYREAAERVKLGLALVQFPGNCFPLRRSSEVNHLRS
jgi:hypothetical protein